MAFRARKVFGSFEKQPPAQREDVRDNRVPRPERKGMLSRQRKNCNSSYFNIVPNIYYVQLLSSKWAKIHDWCAEFILSWENIPARPNPCSSFFYRYASRDSWENIKSIHLVYKERVHNSSKYKISTARSNLCPIVTQILFTKFNNLFPMYYSPLGVYFISASFRH